LISRLVFLVRLAGRIKKKQGDLEFLQEPLVNPAELDKSLFAGIIYAKCVDNSATVTN
jgi:hypothetical protein